jgi:segregation and condensation protein A
METTDVKFQLDVFEGPLDLLLHLIKTNELEISEISISTITSQYLEYMRLMESMDLEVAGDYLVMAATLINVKLRALLPAEDEESEEDGEDLDEFMSAKLLMQRLIEYRRFKEAAHELGRGAERQSQIFMRDVALPKLAEAEGDDTLQGDLALLLEAFARVIRFVDRRDFHEVHGDEFAIEDKIDLLRRRTLVEDRIRLRELFEQCRAKIEMVVTLLAVLELCRLKELRVAQGGEFDEILLVSRREGDRAVEEELAGQARAAEALEADIAANRTGVVDDGTLPDDESGIEVDAATSGTAPGAAGEESDPDMQARVIELSASDDAAGEGRSRGDFDS